MPLSQQDFQRTASRARCSARKLLLLTTPGLREEDLDKLDIQASQQEADVEDVDAAEDEANVKAFLSQEVPIEQFFDRMCGSLNSEAEAQKDITATEALELERGVRCEASNRELRSETIAKATTLLTSLEEN